MIVTTLLLNPNEVTSKHVSWVRVEKDGANIALNCIIKFNSNNTIQYKRVIGITKTSLRLDTMIKERNVNTIRYTRGRCIYVLTYNL